MIRPHRSAPDIAFDGGGDDVDAAVVVLSFVDAGLSTAAERLDAACSGGLTRAAAAVRDFQGEAGQVLDVPAPAGLAAERVLVVGAGKRADLDGAGVERATALAWCRLRNATGRRLTIDLRALPSELGAHAALGIRLASYAYTPFLSEERAKPPRLAGARIRVDEPGAAAAAFEPIRIYADACDLVRDLVNAPPNHLFPESFVETLQTLAPPGLALEVLNEKAMRDLGMGALLSVGEGSARESRLVTLRWRGAPRADAAPVALVGKGVCFDSGGLSLKTVGGMRMMKTDMAGAAVVAALLLALCGRQAPINAVGVLGLVENMPDGAAARPGDVVRSMSGQTIEIVNTDCEGRMVLADALWRAHAAFAPYAMVDIATLTEGVCVALGGDHAGLFANDEALASALLEAGAASGEPAWRLPLASDLKRRQAEIADLRQDWNGPGATVAATFLEAFTGGRRWAHLDIAGVAWRDDNDDPRFGSGPTSFGLRLLDAWTQALEGDPHWR